MMLIPVSARTYSDIQQWKTDMYFLRILFEMFNMRGAALKAATIDTAVVVEKELEKLASQKPKPIINPASGLPMNGMFDIEGNVYGEDSHKHHL